MARKNNTATIMILLLAIGLGAYFFILPQLQASTDNVMDVQFYDSSGNVIYDSGEFATVSLGGASYENVEYVKFKVSAKNVGETDLTVSLSDASPTALNNALSISSIQLIPGQEKVWETSLINADQFVSSGTVTFSIQIKGQYLHSGVTKYLYKDSSITLKFEEDPDTAGLDVTIGPAEGDDNEFGNVIFRMYYVSSTSTVPRWIAYNNGQAVGSPLVGMSGVVGSNCAGTCDNCLGTKLFDLPDARTHKWFYQGDDGYYYTAYESSGNCQWSRVTPDGGVAYQAVTSVGPTEPYSSNGWEIYG